MNNINCKKAKVEDYEAISRFIADQNRNPKSHCIHSDTGKEYQSILNEIIRLDSISEICFMIAFQNGNMIGTLGCEFDEEIGRGWLRGPFIHSAENIWEGIATNLLNGLLISLPSSIHILDSFLNIYNERGNSFYLDQGFEKIRLVHVYVSPAPENKLIHPGLCTSLLPHQKQEFIGLHDSIFPQTYASGQRIFEKLGNLHQVFVCSQGKEIVGYVYATIEEDSGDGSVEFIGVREDAREKGIGRQLLQTALHWLFEIKKVTQTTLVVNDDLANARSLYESVGFKLKYTGEHNRKEW